MLMTINQINREIFYNFYIFLIQFFLRNELNVTISVCFFTEMFFESDIAHVHDFWLNRIHFQRC